jgi:UDP-N-acetylmuramoyl-tripeptide--D-alanyl-D-alanine ligase
MKAFSILEIRKIIEGELIQGSDELVIDYIPYYQKLRPEKKNVLIFIKHKDEFDLNYIKSRLPCAIVTHLEFDSLDSIHGLTVIRVQNISRAFWKFVEYYRGLFSIPVVAITGTCGKTTTKEMITHILRAEKRVQSTVNSANSRLAHLHYLLGINERTDVAVIETAVGKPGDVTYAGKFFKPTIGIITNIGACHLTACKTIEAYKKAKGEMVSTVHNEGVLILNADDEKTKTISLEPFNGKIIYFGIENNADFQASDIQYSQGGMRFTLIVDNTSYPVFVTGYGEHQIYNALAALATVKEIGMNMRQATKRLATFKNLGRHLEISSGFNGATIIDDTWNFNTTSLEAGMRVLKQLGDGKQRIALFTDMASLGNYADQLHKEAGEIVYNYGAETIITVGNLAKNMANYALSLGLNGKVYSFNDYGEVYELLRDILNDQSTLLIKSFGNNVKMINLATYFKNKHR